MEQFNETTLRDYIRVLFRQKAVVITCFVTVMVTVIIGIMLKTPEYEATVKMLISAEKQVDSPYYRDFMGRANIEAALTQSEIVKSNPVIERSVKVLGLFSKPLDYEKNYASPLKAKLVSMQARMLKARMENLPESQRVAYQFRLAMEDLIRHIRVEPIRDTNMFTISVRDYSQLGAAIIANVVSRSYVIFDLEQQVVEMQLKYGEKHSTVIQLKDSIEQMNKQLTGQPLPNIEAIGPASVKIIEQASVPIKPIGPPPALVLLLAFFMAIFLGIMLAFMFEYMDQTFKTPQEVESYLNLPYLGSVPAKGKSKSYDTLAEQILLLARDKNLKTVLFTTAQAGEDAANIVVGVGRILAEKESLKVLVVDANFRHFSFKKFMNLPAGPGLVDVIEEKVTFEKSVQTVGKNLAVLGSGSTQINPVTVLDSGRMNLLLADAVRKYDLVLISSADLTHKDALLLSVHCDGTVLVVDEGRTRKQVVRVAVAPLQEKKANLLGVILNNRTYAIPKAIYNWV